MFKVKSTFLTVLIAISASSIVAQQSHIHGTVAVFNSQFETGKRQYVANASVDEDFEKGHTLTAEDGSFRLVLVGIKEQEKVSYSVKKKGLEVVNTDVLQAVAGQENRLQVYMAPVGKIAENKLTYYRINREMAERHLTRRLDSLDKEISALVGKEDIYKAQIEGLQQEVDQLVAAFSKIDALVSTLTERYARVNLDDMSDAYQEAFRYFQKGELEEAINILGTVDLEKYSLGIAQEVKSIEQQKIDYANQTTVIEDKKRQTVEALLFKSELHAVQLQTTQQEECYLLILRLYPDDNKYVILYADFLKSIYRDKEAIELYSQVVSKPATFSQKRKAYRSLYDLYIKQGNNVLAEKMLMEEKNEITMIQDSIERQLAQIDNYEALGAFFVDINLRESFENMQAGTTIAENLAKIDSNEYRRILLSNYITVFEAYKYSNINWDYRDLYQRAKKYWENSKKIDSVLYFGNERHFKESLWDILKETVSMGRESCPRCIEMLQRDLQVNRELEADTDVLLMRKSLLQNLASFYYMQRDIDSADQYFLEALAIGESLRQKSPILFNVEYALDLTKYVQHRSKTGRTSPDSLYNLIVEIFDEYSYRKQVRDIEKEYFIPDFSKWDAFYQKALKEISSLTSGLYFLQKLNNPEGEYETLLQITTILERYHTEKNKNRRISSLLAIHLGHLSWAMIHKGDYLSAEKNARRAVSLDNSQKWIAGRLAIALLYLGQYEQAVGICKENRNEYYYNENKIYINQWIIAFCGDMDQVPQNENLERMKIEMNCGF